LNLRPRCGAVEVEKFLGGTKRNLSARDNQRFYGQAETTSEVVAILEDWGRIASIAIRPWARDYWAAGKALYDPGNIRVPTLLIHAQVLEYAVRCAQYRWSLLRADRISCPGSVRPLVEPTRANTNRIID
jgi:hypothetical protein